MTSVDTTRRHLHLDDCPQALAALAATLTARRADVVGLADIGYEATDTYYRDPAPGHGNPLTRVCAEHR
jgi:hypothetical protein